TPIPIAVGESVNIRNAVGDGAIINGHNPNWNIQRITEVGKLIGPTIFIRILENGNPVRAGAWLRGKWIFKRLCYPHAPPRIKGYVDRFSDIRFGSKQLNLKAFRQEESFLLIFRCSGFR